MDSGSVDHVMNDDEAPHIAVVESKRSKEGRHYAGANGVLIENEGEMHMKLVDVDDGFAPLNAIFQSCKVTRPLCSVSKICDTSPEVEVSFNAKRCVVTKKGKAIAQFRRRGGLYVCRMKIKKNTDRDDKSKVDFQRQGVSR
jgi:hypothetical protein